MVAKSLGLTLSLLFSALTLSALAGPIDCTNEKIISTLSLSRISEMRHQQDALQSKRFLDDLTARQNGTLPALRRDRSMQERQEEARKDREALAQTRTPLADELARQWELCEQERRANRAKTQAILEKLDAEREAFDRKFPDGVPTTHTFTNTVRRNGTMYRTETVCTFTRSKTRCTTY